MARKLSVHDIRQFNEDGIRERRIKNYHLREGIIRLGGESEKFYIDRAKRLYTYEAVDRIILLSRQEDRHILRGWAKKIAEKSGKEWRRGAHDWLIEEYKETYRDKAEIIDSEKKGKEEYATIIQINLVSNIYWTAKYYFSYINDHPDEISKKLVRILAGLYPKENDLLKNIPKYNPKDVIHLITQITDDQALIDYFNFFGEFFAKERWNVEEILDKLNTLLRTISTFRAGIEDLHYVLEIIYKSLSSDSISDIIELKGEINDYFQTIPEPEYYTDMLLRKNLDLIVFLEKFQEINDFRDKLYFLDESRKIIRESERLVEKKFVEPFKTFYSNILKIWMDITFEEGTNLLGKPSLEAKLLTKRTIWKEIIPIYFTLKNNGIATAEKVGVTLHGSPDYKVSGKNHQTIDSLPRFKEVDVEFHIRPLKKTSAKLNFSINHKKIKRINLSDVLFFAKQRKFTEAPNPYNFTRPAGGDMFFDREDLFQWIQNNMMGSAIYQNVQITGQRRTGKTSFLKELQKRLNSDHHCLFIDLEFYPEHTDEKFLCLVCQELHRAIPNNVSPPNEQEFAKKGYMAFGNYIRSLTANSSDSKKIIIIFDEFDKVESKIGEGLFKPGFLLYLRAFFQHNSRANVIIGGNLDHEKLDSPEWQEFFTILNRKTINVLDKDSAAALITEPLKDDMQYDEYAVKKILDFSGRNPYYIQLLCQTVVDYLNEKKKQNFVEVEDVNTIMLDEAREKAESTLRLTWEELDPTEKNILFALSRLEIQYKRSLELKELEQYLRQNDVKIKRWRLFSLLGRLEEKDIIEKSGESPPFYNFNIRLLGDWIAEHGNFVGE